MKTFVIKDESRNPALLLGYLEYYEKSRSFLVELDDAVDPGDFPIMFHVFARKGIFTIDPGWSRRWVDARIIPRDRQNLAEILRANGLKEYDEMKLLQLAEGRCAQDECSIAPASADDPPEWLQTRRRLRLTGMNCLPGALFLLTFADETIAIVPLKNLVSEDNRWLIAYEKDEERFGTAQLLPGGSGISWGDENRLIPLHLLRGAGIPIPMNAQQLRLYAYQSAIDTSEACRILGCSRQYLNQLVRAGKLVPMRGNSTTSLFFRCDVERLMW